MSSNMIASFPVTEVRTQGTAGVGLGVGSGGLDGGLGTEVEIFTPVATSSLTLIARQVYMLVEASLAADNFDARGKMFKWQDRTAYQVRPCSATTDIVAGIAPYRDPLAPQLGTAGAAGISSLDTTNYFWICVEASLIEVVHGDDGTNLLGTSTYVLVTPDNDSDLGKVAGTATFATGTTCGRYVSGTAADNALMVVNLVRGI